MNAGNLSISVEADMKALQAQFAAIERGFQESGKRAVALFSGAVSSGTMGSGMSDKLIPDLQKAVSDAISSGIDKAAPRIAKKLTDSITEAIAGGIKGAKITAVAGPSIERSMATAGEKGGFNFGDQFSKKATGMIRGLAGPMIAAQLANTVADILRSDKSMPDAILDGIKSIPFVGAFANLGEAIYDATFGAADKAAEDLRAKEAAARDARVMGAARQMEFDREAQAAQASLMIENRKLEIQSELLAVRATGDQRAIARAEAEAKAQELALQFNLDSAKTEDERVKKLLVDRHELQLGLIREELIQQLDAITEQEEADAERQRKLEEAEASRVEKSVSVNQKAEERMADDAIEEQERIAKQRAQAMEALRREEMSLEQERRAAAVAGLGSAQTALGSFRFDAYPAAAKKANDERIVRALEKIRDQQKQGGFV